MSVVGNLMRCVFNEIPASMLLALLLVSSTAYHFLQVSTKQHSKKHNKEINVGKEAANMVFPVEIHLLQGAWGI